MAGKCDQPDRRGDTRQREQQRNADRDECAEHEQEHDDRDRDRPLAGQLQLVREHLVERLSGRDRAGLADVEARVPIGDRGRRILEAADSLFGGVGGAPHVPLDVCGPAVLRDLVAVARVER